jgi:GNAT superfamily N-acetyltransferase
MENFRIQEITGTDLVPLTFELRYRVWSLEVQLPESYSRSGRIRDEHDEHARHWGAFSDAGRLVASARVCLHQREHDILEADCYSDLQLRCPVASFNRLVVEPSARRHNIATSLDINRIEAARTMGAASIIVAPTHESRVHALANVGFTLTTSTCTGIYSDGVVLPVMVMHLITDGGEPSERTRGRNPRA